MGSLQHFACAVVASATLVSSLLPIPALAADRDEASATDGFNALSTFPEFASMVDSATTDAALVLQGTVEQITGASMPGAQVLLWAWPRNETVRDLSIGGELELTPMARTVASEDGKYVLRAPVTDLLLGLAGPDGLDIELDVFHGDRHYTHLSQVTPLADGTWVRKLTGLVEGVGRALETAGNVLDLTLDRTKAALEQGLGITGGGAVSADYRKPVPPGCTPFEKVGFRDAPQIVATTIVHNGASANVIYNRTATAETSVGGSINGGLFSSMGSRSRTMGVEGGFLKQASEPKKTLSSEYPIEVRHVVLRRSCARDFRGGEDVLFITSPMEGTGGGRPVSSRYGGWKCERTDPRAADAGFEYVETTNTRAAIYKAAFELEVLPGSKFLGSSQSGYSESVTIRYNFHPKRGGYWCGDTDKPKFSRRVQAFGQ